MRAVAILGDIAHVVPTARGRMELSGSESLEDAILGIITRHPMREEELITGLYRWTPESVQEVLAKLKASGQARTVERYGIWF